MTNVLCPMPKAQFFDATGAPLAGGRLYTSVAGVPGTPKATYTDRAGGTPNANPVVLDSAGRANIWLDGAYYMELWTGVKTSPGSTLVWTQDNVTASLLEDSEVTLTDVAGKTLRDLFDGGYDLTPKTLDLITKGPWVDVRAYMDGLSGRPALAAWQASPMTVDVSAAIQAAIEACRLKTAARLTADITSPYATTASTLYFAPGIYRVETPLWFGIDTDAVGWDATKIVQKIEGAGAILLGATTGKPVMDLSGAFGMTIRGLTIHTEGTTTTAPATAPNVGILLARTGTATPNNPSAGLHQFIDVKIMGHFMIAPVYNYASEINQWTNCFLFNRSGKAAYYATSKNETAGLGSYVTSDYATIDHTVQSAYGDFFTGTTIKQSTDNPNAGGAVVWVEAISFGPAFVNCYIDGSGSVAMPNIYVVKSNGEAGTNGYTTGLRIISTQFEYHGVDQPVVEVAANTVLIDLTLRDCTMTPSANNVKVGAGGIIKNADIQKTNADATGAPVTTGGTGEIYGSQARFFPARQSVVGTTWVLTEGELTRDGAYHAIDLSGYDVPKTAKYLHIKLMAETSAAAEANTMFVRGYGESTGYEGLMVALTPPVSTFIVYHEGLVRCVENAGVAKIEYSVPANFNIARILILGYYL